MSPQRLDLEDLFLTVHLLLRLPRSQALPVGIRVWGFGFRVLIRTQSLPFSP